MRLKNNSNFGIYEITPDEVSIPRINLLTSSRIMNEAAISLLYKDGAETKGVIMEDKERILEALKEIRKIEEGLFNSLIGECADYLIKNHKKIVEETSGIKYNSKFAFAERSRDKKPTHDGWYWKRCYSGKSLTEFKDGKWQDPTGYRDARGDWHEHPKFEWWDIVEVTND